MLTLKRKNDGKLLIEKEDTQSFMDTLVHEENIRLDTIGEYEVSITERVPDEDGTLEEQIESFNRFVVGCLTYVDNLSNSRISRSGDLEAQARFRREGFSIASTISIGDGMVAVETLENPTIH